MLLYLAGHETTVNLIGNGTLALLRHRDQLERLVADPSLDANAVDELLRYDSPVQVSRRIATTDIEIAGVQIGAGELVLTLLGSSNRDEGKWGPTAADVDLGREGAGAHLSFGSGIHHCLGSALARLEGAEADPGPGPSLPRHGAGHGRPRVERPHRAARARQPARDPGDLTLRPAGSASSPSDPQEAADAPSPSRRRRSRRRAVSTTPAVDHSSVDVATKPSMMAR